MKYHKVGPVLAVFGKFDPLNVVGHSEDSKNARPCMILHFWAIVRQNPLTAHFSRRVRGKRLGLIFHIFAQMLPYDRFVQILGYLFISWMQSVMQIFLQSFKWLGLVKRQMFW